MCSTCSSRVPGKKTNSQYVMTYRYYWLFPLLVIACGLLVTQGEEYQAVRKLKYEVSLSHVRLTQSNWWDPIGRTGHYLGALPLDNLGHYEQIRQSGINGVLVLLEDFERHEGWFNRPVNASQWAVANITVHWVDARDFHPLNRTQFDDAVQWLFKETAAGRNVYVHCKAGRGRSASVVIAFLMILLEWEYDTAHRYISLMRPRVNIGERQRDAIRDYVSCVFSYDEESEILNQSRERYKDDDDEIGRRAASVLNYLDYYGQ